MNLMSSAFDQNGTIPRKYTCDGEDMSPPLEWHGVPANARTVALICDDPDAPKKDFVHWVVFNLPANQGSLPEHVPTKPELSGGARQGTNDFGRVGYGGPCPPGGTHRYRFALFALDSALELPPACTRGDVLSAMEGHVLEKAELNAAYTRAR